MKNNSAYYLVIVLFSCCFMACEEVETTTPVSKNIEDAVFASGYIEQENNYTVSAKVEGILVSFDVKEGDQLIKEELIGIIESEVQNNQLQDALVVHEDAKINASPSAPQLQNIETQIKQAKEQLAFDKENYLRYKDLYSKKSVARIEFEKTELQYLVAQSNLLALKKQYEEAQAALVLNVERSRVQVSTQQSLLRDYQLFAEMEGQVIQVFKKEGELVRRGEAVAKIGSGAYLIKLFVSEEDIIRVDVGQEVAVNINTYPDRAFDAEITKIYPAFDEAEQSYVVEAQFKQLPEKMFSGTQLQANIKVNSRKSVLMIPTSYVKRGSFVQLENGEEKEIVAGSKNGTWTEVVSGIMASDIIIKPTN